MNCNICHSNNMQLFHKGTRDNKEIDVYRCCECGMLQLSQFIVSNEDYENGKMHWEQYSSANDNFGKETWEAWLQETAFDDKRRANTLKSLCIGKKVLDFGCGNGGFIRNMLPFVEEIMGVELEGNAKKHLEKEGIKIKSSIESTNQKWDIITMFQVLEHLDDPRKYLRMVYNHLSENGLVIIETPNADDALISLYESEAFMDFTFWSEHLMLYTSSNLEHIMKECGYQAVDNGQVQRYPLSNHLYWLSKNRPGGHKKWTQFNSKELTFIYETILKEQKKCDTLFGVFKKVDR